jgi:hypothetical protein
MIKECDEDLQHASEAPDAPSSAAAEGRPRRKAHSGERLAQARLAGSSGRTTLLVDTAHQGCDIARSHTYGPEPPGLPAPIAFPNPARPSILNRKRAFAATKARDHFLLCVPKFSYVPNRVEIQFAM